jgi:hypothetical protein
MNELLILGAITVCIFGVAYYQSYRDKLRWKRISSGMSLFGDRKDIPPLVVDGLRFDPHDRPVLVVWGDSKRNGFETVHDAKRQIERQNQAGKARAKAARIFAWDGESWNQKK